MQQKIDPVISRRLAAVPKNGVIEQIRKRRQRPVNTGLAIRPPKSVLENERGVVNAGLSNTRISLEEHLIVERQSGAKRIRECERRERKQSQARDPIASWFDNFSRRPGWTFLLRSHEL